MKLDEAIKIAKSKSGVDPIYGYESTNYFVFVMADKNGEILGNNCSYVINKNTKVCDWIPQNAFPLKDGGNFIREFNI